MKIKEERITLLCSIFYSLVYSKHSLTQKTIINIKKCMIILMSKPAARRKMPTNIHLQSEIQHKQFVYTLVPASSFADVDSTIFWGCKRPMIISENQIC